MMLSEFIIKCEKVLAQKGDMPVWAELHTEGRPGGGPVVIQGPIVGASICFPRNDALRQLTLLNPMAKEYWDNLKGKNL